MESNIIKNRINIENISSISPESQQINNILLLHNTHNLVCSYGDEAKITIYLLNFDIKSNLNQKKYDILQNILDPNFYSIEFLYETKPNPFNKNYLLLCSDMIHVFYLYDNDKKSILLQSINNFNFQYINQVIETTNGKIISVSNEYKISVFNNNLISTEEIIDYSLLFKLEEKALKEFKEEIYELEKNKINKNNEKIEFVLELFPDKLAYLFYINNEDNEFNDIEEEEEEENDNRINVSVIKEGYFYIKFLDKDYNKISELKICENEDNYYRMFQLDINIMIFIDENYINLIDINYYEVVSKIIIKTDFSFYFQKNSDFLTNNFICYLLLGTFYSNNLEYNDEDNSNNSSDIDNETNLDIKFYDLKNIINTCSLDKYEIEYKNKTVNFRDILNIYKIIDISIIGNKDNIDEYYCAIFNLSKDSKSNNVLKINFFKMKIYE